MNKTTVPIKGMHCRSCELLIREELEQVPGVVKIDVNYKKGEAVLHHKHNKLNFSKIESAIADAGYEVGIDAPKPWLTRNSLDYQYLLEASMVLVGLYLLFVFTGVKDLIDPSRISYSSLPLIFLIGLTAGLSTCMAVVGGLILSLSSRFSQQHPNASAVKKLRPVILFNIGRVVSYTLLGGLIGLLGSVFTLSSSLLGLLTLGIGFLMLIFGLQLTGISPRLAQYSFTFPSGIARFFGFSSNKSQSYGDVSAVLTGAATFFLPCGFTQSMQLLAITSGSFTQGMLILGVFALGTIPGLLSLGGIASLVKGIFAQKFYKFAGLLILFFAWINLSSGVKLTGINRVLAVYTQAETGSETVADSETANHVNDGKPTTLNANWKQRSWLTPQTLTTTVGSPTTLTINVLEDGTGCAGTITIPGLYKDYEMLQADTQIEMSFTPKKSGRYPIMCGMGMITFGYINVR